MTATGLDVPGFWKAIGNRAVGAAVVTANGEEGWAGFLALSATHLSAKPPRIMVSIDAGTSALSAVREGRCFSVNYLSAGSQDLIAVFSGKAGLRGVERFTTAVWKTLATGAPILDGAVGAFDCTLDEIIERDGTVIAIAIGTLSDVEVDLAAEPLVTFRGAYYRLSPLAPDIAG
jgi:flavin reductase (DIM6/NTAB) family NADH-FMN oxidoreductase RutF